MKDLSRNVTQGVERAPNRSLFYALGYTKEELERPLIGVVCSYNEIVPGHMNIDKIVDAVKLGVAMAGNSTGVPPAARTPALTASAILSRFMCPGTISL